MAITTLAGSRDAMPGQVLRFIKNYGNTANPGWAFGSPWLISGVPSQGVTPSSGVTGDIPTSATAGSIGSFVNPASGNTYLGRIVARTRSTTVPSDYLCLYDRLWQNSGINSTLTTLQSIASIALTRPNSTGIGAEAWWQCYTAMGAGTPTVTLGYTNSAGTASRVGSSQVLTTTMTVGTTGQFTLNSGDTGVQSIQDWTANATFTSGTIGLVIRRHIASTRLDPSVSTFYGDVSLAMPRIYDSACIEVVSHYFSNQTATMEVTANLIQG